jgi:acyl carrier protein
MHPQETQGAEHAAARPAPGEAVLQSWLIARIAALIDQPETAIEIGQPFSSFALDSVATIGLTGTLQEWLGIKLPATLLWEYPSIESLARHLAARSRT